jgi:ABC-2 type transport system ATP-binding protein
MDIRLPEDTRMLFADLVSKSYARGQWALRDLTLTAPDGTITALLGHNGAGKTTALRIAAGILPATSGSVSVDGHPLDSADHDVLELRRSIAYVPEVVRLLDHLSAREYLSYAGHLYGIRDDRELHARVAAAVSAFAIDGDADRYLGELSAGMRRRVTIAAVLVSTPRLLLLDEPANHLDPVGVQLLLSVMGTLRAKGATILMATHRVDIAERVADHLIVLDHGTTCFSGSLGDLRSRYSTLGQDTPLEDLYVHLMGTGRA